MNAWMDGYTQMTIGLSHDDVKTLEKDAKLEGKLWRTSGDELPLRIFVKKITYMRAESLPRDKPYEQKEAYEIDINKGALATIKKGKAIGAQPPTINLRSVYMILENLL